MEDGRYDLAFVPVSYMERYVADCGACRESMIMPFSVNIDKFKNLRLTKNIDAMTAYTVREDVYPNRKDVLRAIKETGVVSHSGKTSMNRYIELINESKIFVTSNNIFRSLSMKYTECMSCGTFLLADEPEDLNRFGYKDGQHLVIYNGLKDLKDKINYFLKHDKEREQIAKSGMEFVRKNYNHGAMVDIFEDHVKRRWDIK